MERNVGYSASPFKALLRRALIREKVLHRAKQIGTEPTALLLSAGDGATRQQVGEEFMRKFARRIGTPQLVAKECSHRFVVGVA